MKKTRTGTMLVSRMEVAVDTEPETVICHYLDALAGQASTAHHDAMQHSMIAMVLHPAH